MFVRNGAFPLSLIRLRFSAPCEGGEAGGGGRRSNCFTNGKYHGADQRLSILGNFRNLTLKAKQVIIRCVSAMTIKIRTQEGI